MRVNVTPQAYPSFRLANTTVQGLQDAKRLANVRACNDAEKWPDSDSRRAILLAINRRDAKLDDYDAQIEQRLKARTEACP